jgi:hypothetical protein
MATGNPARETKGLIFTLLPDEAVTLDVEAFDALVHHNGIKLIHYRAIPCPIGLTDEQDIHRTTADHSGCSNGFIYKAIGRVTTVFTSNSKDIKRVDSGMMDGSTVAVTFPRFYDSDPTLRVMVRPFDRFFLEEEDITVAIWDKTHRRSDGKPDRVEFPIKRVQHLVDANGQWWYRESFTVNSDGDLVWNPGVGPPPGVVYSIWYEYQPFWCCDRLIHEIRVTPVPDYIDTAKVGMERTAYGAILHREYVYRNQQNDDQAPDNRGRKQRAVDINEPQDNFGPR